MHADTVHVHERLTREARDLVAAWEGTEPMRGAPQVRTAMRNADVPAEEMDALLPYVVDAAQEAGILPPMWRLCIDGRAIGGERPDSLASADRVLVAALAGQPPGTTGHVEQYVYPNRRGSHAYRRERNYIVDEHGTPRVDG